MTNPYAPSWVKTPAKGLQLNSVAVCPDGALALCGTSNEFGAGAFALFCYDGDGALRWTRPATRQTARGCSAFPPRS